MRKRSAKERGTSRRRDHPAPRTRSPPRQLVAHARRAGRRSRVSGAAAQRVPFPGRGRLRSGRPAYVLEADGRVDGARRHHRLHPPTHGKDRPLRPAARGGHSGPAAVLRNVDDARRDGDRTPRREPRGAANQSRGQPAPPRQSRRHGHFCAGGDPESVRSRPVARADASGRDSPVARFSLGPRVGADRTAGLSRDAGSASSPNRSRRPRLEGSCRSFCRAIRLRGGTSGILSAARTRARVPAWHSASSSTRSCASIKPTSFSRSTPIFSAAGAGSLTYARDFSARRRPELAARMNRLYALESMPTSTGARADHRLPLRPSEVETVARQIAAAIGVAGAAAGGPPLSGRAAELAPAWIAAVAKDLQAHKGHEPRGRGRQPAASGACPRPCDERCARQHRPQHRVHESRRSRAGRTGPVASRSRTRYERRPGGRPDRRRAETPSTPRRPI